MTAAYLKDLSAQARQDLSPHMACVDIGRAVEVARPEDATVVNGILFQDVDLKADLGSRRIDRQSQNMTVAASPTPDMKVLAHLS
jgi:hypothetical protein